MSKLRTLIWIVAGGLALLLVFGWLTSKEPGGWQYFPAAGLAAIAVAFFTFELWQSTEKLWKASTEQARMLERSEAALLVAELIAYAHPEDGGFVRPVIWYRISNYGRTAATVRRFQDRHRWVENLPAEFFDRQPLDVRPEENILLVPQLRTNRFRCRLDPAISLADWNGNPNRRSHVIIRIEYEDAFGRVFEQGFALAIVDEEPLSYNAVGGRAYNYRKELRQGGGA